jgi:subfamily B ATP-binding cassette protein HlyB/CyaB
MNKKILKNVVDQQLDRNDCGISAVKIICNIFDINICRNYIKEQIPLYEQGIQLNDIKSFFEKHCFEASFKLIDLDIQMTDLEYLNSLTPFILTKKSNNNFHYIVVNKVNSKNIEVYDPAVAKPYRISISELKRIVYYNESYINYVDISERIENIVNAELAEYDIYRLELADNYTVLFNKLIYFSYIKENFGFKDLQTEKDFLIDLLKNQDISNVPKHFKTLKYNKEKVRITAPLVLSVKPKEKIEYIESSLIEKSKSIYLLLFKQLGNFKQLWYIYIFAALFSATTTQLAVFTNQLLIDEILPSYNLGTLLLFALGLGIYKLFDLGTSIYKAFVGIHLGNVLDKYFLRTFDEKINSFSLPYIHSYKKGDLIERISDAIKLKTFFLRFFTNVLIDIFVSIYSLAILFYINKQITFVVIGVMILFYFWFRFITPALKQNERLRYIRKADFLSKMIEKVEGIQVIKSFRTEYSHSNKIFHSINEYLKIQLRNGYIDLVNKTVVALIIIVSSIVIMYYLTDNAITKQINTLGQIITFITLSSRIFTSLKNILDENLTLQENEVILKRFMDFDEKQKQIAVNGIKDFIIEKIKIKNLSFGYLSNEYILKNINLEITKGQAVKIEGQNGSGKSTLSKILTALYEPNSGEIIINNNDRRFYNPNSIKDKILLVTNEDILFNDTIQENICLGKVISTVKILQLAKQIDLYDFITSKDEVLDFIINENGKNLSTGQRKKILLMRALLSGAEIIILDEVLSGIDMESRNKVEDLIGSTKDKTFIIISHEPISNIQFSKKYRITDGELMAI